MQENLLQSVDNALKILELLSEDEPELGVTELSKKLGLGKSTVHRLLITLQHRGFVVQNALTSKYKLGIKIANMGAGILNRINIINECKPYLEELSQATGEASHLALYNRGEITFVQKISGRKPAIMGSMIGLKKPAYSTGTGKVLLAHLPPEQLEEYLQKIVLKRNTPYTILEKEKLREVLDRIKRDGYGEDQQEDEEGLVCFAAPVRNGSGEVIAAISVSGAASRMNEEKEELIHRVKATAEQISRACGWCP